MKTRTAVAFARKTSLEIVELDLKGPNAAIVGFVRWLLCSLLMLPRNCKY